LFLLLLTFTAAAMAIRPRPVDSSKTPLVWVSDDNPVRQAEIRLFDATHPEFDLRLDPAGANGDLMMQKVIVQCSAGVGPDVFDCYGPHELQCFVKSGIAWDVRDEL